MCNAGRNACVFASARARKHSIVIVEFVVPQVNRAINLRRICILTKCIVANSLPGPIMTSRESQSSSMFDATVLIRQRTQRTEYTFQLPHPSSAAYPNITY